jgi:lipopolysaccharide assembly protein A
MRIIAWIFWIILIAAVALFASLNSHVITIDFFVHKVKIYFPLLLLIELIIGALLGVLAMLPSLLRAKTQRRKANRKIKQLEKELEKLKTR